MKCIEKPPLSLTRTYDCPGCGDAMRRVESCNAYACDDCGLFFRETERLGIFNTSVFDPIVEESKKHYDDKMMVTEMEHFHLPKEELEKLSVGYLPFGYWAWRIRDSRFGTLTLPMKNWKGETSNVLGKHVGSDEKLDLEEAVHRVDDRSFGVFNIDAFWQQEVHVYSNPTDCLAALIHRHENAACVCGKFVMPEIFAPEKIIIHAPVLPLDEFAETVKEKSHVLFS